MAPRNDNASMIVKPMFPMSVEFLRSLETRALIQVSILPINTIRKIALMRMSRNLQLGQQQVCGKKKEKHHRDYAVHGEECGVELA